VAGIESWVNTDVSVFPVCFCDDHRPGPLPRWDCDYLDAVVPLAAVLLHPKQQLFAYSSCGKGTCCTAYPHFPLNFQKLFPTFVSPLPLLMKGVFNHLHICSLSPWCALPTRRAMVTHSPYTLPRYMLLDLPGDIICSVARYRLCAHTLRIETVTWTHSTSPNCDLCNDNDVQDEQHVLFHCTHPHVVSLRRTYASLFSSAGLNILGQEKNKLYFFLHALIVFYEQVSSRTS